MKLSRTLAVTALGAVVLAATATACSSGGSTAAPATTVPATATTPASDIPPEVSGDGGPVAVLDAQFGHTYPVMPSSHPVQTSADVTVYPPTSSTSQQYAPAPQRAVFVTFKVMFKATSENVQPGGRFAFEVRTADGQHYNLAAGYGERDTLTNSTLHNGEVLSGTMTADLPAAHGTLTYAPAFEAGPTQVEWPF